MTDPDDYAEDRDHDPTLEPKSSRGWLALIVEAEKAFDDYQTRADNIDRQYASLSRLANHGRDREFQMFWANIEVLKPSVYSRAPVPVVVPRFKDRRPIPRTASEFLERAAVVAFDLDDIDSTMRLVRDDVALQSRGVMWCRYETKGESETESERVRIEHLDRRDFVHEAARNWREVGWVARRAWLSRKEMRARFCKQSGKAYQDASFTVRRQDRENGGADRSQKAGVWEIWSRTDNKVVWVTEGVETLLDESEPHLRLSGFYPCPMPAYGTVQRRSLVPIPDMLFYKDQLEEINDLTGRISALASAVKVRGFYPSGAGEVGDAIEAALKSLDDRQVMVPISNWAAFGGSGGAKDTIVWLPIDMIVTTIAALIDQRRQIIDDVYQITGLSDIMRGATDPSETLGAQQLKSQYGSIRIRDRQAEMVRIARDAGRIAVEIMAENFSKETLSDMAQMELPSRADIKRQMRDLERQAREIADDIQQQIAQAQADPQMMAQAKAQPDQAKAMLEQAQQQAQQQIGEMQAQAAKLQKTVTLDDVMELLREQRLRPFVLDIETDSTIQPDEDAEKQRRTEFVSMLGGLLQQVAPLVQAQPEMGEFAGEVIKFALAPYRVGRQLESSVDEMVDQMRSKAGQPQPNPEAAKLKADQAMQAQQMQMDQQKMQAEMQMKGQELQAKAQMDAMKVQSDREAAEFDRAAKREESDAKMQALQAQMVRDERKGALEERKLQMDIEARQAELALKAHSAAHDMQRDELAAQRDEAAFAHDISLADRAAERDDRTAMQGT